MIEHAEFDAIEVKRQSQYYTQMDTLIDKSAVRFARPAEAILAAEGRRASAAYIDGGRSAAIAEPSADVWMDYLTRLWIVTVPDAGELANSWLVAEAADAALVTGLSSAAASQIAAIGPSKAASIVDTSRDAISYAIDVEATAPAVTASRILKTVTSRRSGRAKQIAYTEVHESANYGSITVAAAHRAYDKVWLATPDDRVRDAHIAAHGQVRRLDAVFMIGGERLMYPGDSTRGASAANTVNCRCITGFVRRAR